MPSKGLTLTLLEGTPDQQTAGIGDVPMLFLVLHNKATLQQAPGQVFLDGRTE